MRYVKASKEMPFLSEREVEDLARHYGFADQDSEEKVGSKNEKGVESEEESSTPYAEVGNWWQEWSRGFWEVLIHSTVARELCHVL